MSTDWLVVVVAEARKNHALVTDAASARIQELVNGQLSERQFSAGELRSTAKELIAKLVAPVSDEERPQ